MPHDPDEYRRLLGSVRNAYARHGHRLFGLETITKEEFTLVYANPKLWDTAKPGRSPRWLRRYRLYPRNSNSEKLISENKMPKSHEKFHE